MNKDFVAGLLNELAEYALINNRTDILNMVKAATIAASEEIEGFSHALLNGWDSICSKCDLHEEKVR